MTAQRLQMGNMASIGRMHTCPMTAGQKEHCTTGELLSSLNSRQHISMLSPKICKRKTSDMYKRLMQCSLHTDRPYFGCWRCMMSLWHIIQFRKARALRTDC